MLSPQLSVYNSEFRTLGRLKDLFRTLGRPKDLF